MRCRTMIDSFLPGSICHAFIGRKMEQRSSSEGQRGSRGGSVKPGGSNASGTVSKINSTDLFTSCLQQIITGCYSSLMTPSQLPVPHHTMVDQLMFKYYFNVNLHTVCACVFDLPSFTLVDLSKSDTQPAGFGVLDGCILLLLGYLKILIFMKGLCHLILHIWISLLVTVSTHPLKTDVLCLLCLQRSFVKSEKTT